MLTFKALKSHRQNDILYAKKYLENKLNKKDWKTYYFFNKQRVNVDLLLSSTLRLFLKVTFGKKALNEKVLSHDT